MWQAEADTELTLSASPATAVGQSKLYPGESRLEYGRYLHTGHSILLDLLNLKAFDQV